MPGPPGTDVGQDLITGKEGTGANKWSTCMDVLRRRITEIDVINGAIVRLGR